MRAGDFIIIKMNSFAFVQLHSMAGIHILDFEDDLMYFDQEENDWNNGEQSGPTTYKSEYNFTEDEGNDGCFSISEVMVF